MSGINGTLEIARRALLAQQAALNTTGNNIANANTEGYSRQRVVMVPNDPTQIGDLKIGTGVRVESIERIRDSYLESRIQNEQSQLSGFETLEAKFIQLETLFNEPSESGLASLMNKFFDSWQELANNPASLSARDYVVQTGMAMTSKFNAVASSQQELSEDVYNEFNDQIEKFNSFSRRLVELNVLMAANSGNSGQSPEYLDERDKILFEMSKIADIHVIENDSGQVMLSLGGKVFLDKDNVLAMTTPNPQTDLAQLHWSDGTTGSLNENGVMGALASFYNDVIPEYQQKLDKLALSIAYSVDQLHTHAYAFDNSTNNRFFAETITGAINIQVSEAIRTNTQKVAASTDGNLGDGSAALEISELQNKNLVITDSSSSDALISIEGLDQIIQDMLNNDSELASANSFMEYYGNVVATVGKAKNEATFSREGQEMFVNQLSEDKESVSGVSLDEEMTNLIKFQRAFQAAAKLIQLANEVTETVINLV